MTTIEVDDLIVLLLGAPTRNTTLQNQLQGITRLEKLIFLLERETSLNELIDEETDFKPYNFGPFSAVVYKAVGYLSGYGLIHDTASISDTTEDTWEQMEALGSERDDPYMTRDFVLTETGRQYYRALANELSPERIHELSRFKDRFGSLPLRQLVRYVYRRYPDMTEASLIREEVLGDG